jgi:hypothetical protein
MATKKRRTQSRKAKTGKPPKSAQKAKNARQAKGAHKAKTKRKRTSAGKPKAAKTKAAKRTQSAGRGRKPIKRIEPLSQGPASLALDDLSDDPIYEPLVDASSVLRIKDKLHRAERDGDEDERKSFSDPSLVVETEAGRSFRSDEPSESPSLFEEDEARREEGRRERASGAAGESLFGSLKKPVG